MIFIQSLKHAHYISLHNVLEVRHPAVPMIHVFFDLRNVVVHSVILEVVDTVYLKLLVLDTRIIHINPPDYDLQLMQSILELLLL